MASLNELAEKIANNHTIAYGQKKQQVPINKVAKERSQAISQSAPVPIPKLDRVHGHETKPQQPLTVDHLSNFISSGQYMRYRR